VELETKVLYLIATSIMVPLKAPHKFIPEVYHEVIPKPPRKDIYVFEYVNVFILCKENICLCYFTGRVPPEAVIRPQVKEVRKPHGWHCTNTKRLRKGVLLFSFPRKLISMKFSLIFLGFVKTPRLSSPHHVRASLLIKLLNILVLFGWSSLACPCSSSHSLSLSQRPLAVLFATSLLTFLTLDPRRSSSRLLGAGNESGKHNFQKDSRSREREREWEAPSSKSFQERSVTGASFI
jgi:hypothetical protein